MGARYLFLVGLSLAAASWPISEAAEDITPSDLALMLAAFSVVLAIQRGALRIVSHYARKPAINGLVAIFFAANTYHFALLTLEASTETRFLLASLAGIVAFVLLGRSVTTAGAFLFAMVFAALSVGRFGYERVALQWHANNNTVSMPVKSDRNVYLISVESLHSPKAFRHLHQITNAPHVEYLKAQGFRVHDSAYSADTTTRKSYQRLLEFSKPMKDGGERTLVFKAGNSTFRSFRDSGYGVQFIYVNNYMELNPALVDHAYPAKGFYVCDNLPSNFFYFVCRTGARLVINRSFFGVRGKVTVGDEIAHLKERIEAAVADSRPWLTISHIAYPFHTAKTHRYDDALQVANFRDKIRGAIPQVDENYRQIISAIKDRDPQAVIVTFGDHGMWLTRGMEKAESNAVFTAEDFVEDRYGVMLGVYPADFCSNRIFEGSSTSILVKSVIECLNGNDEPKVEDLKRARSVFYLKDTVDVGSILARK